MRKIEEINFNIPFTKSDGCIVINPKDWQENTTQLIQAYNMKGEKSITNINKVLATNYSEEVYGNEIQKDDLVFISKQASRISYLKPYKIPKVEGEFANIHLLQVIGKFKDNIISYDNFIPLYNHIFMEKVEISSNSVLDLGDNCKTIIGKVLKVGTTDFNEKWERKPIHIEVGKYVLLRDNTLTEITLDGKDYIASEQSSVIGYFDINTSENFSLDNLVLYENNILLEKYEEEKIEGSSLLFRPNTIDETVSDISELYTDNRFKVVRVNSRNVRVNDKVIADNDYMNYVTIEGKQYFLLNGTKYIYGIFN